MCVKETTHGDVYFTHTKHIMILYRQLLKYIINKSYTLNSVCPKFILNKQESEKIENRNFVVLLYAREIFINLTQ